MTGVIRNVVASVIGLLATLVRVVFSIIGALILIHAAFVLFSANPHNVLVEFTAGIRDNFGWFTKNLFTPKDPTIGQTINDALAGLIWVVVGNLLSKLIMRFAPAKKAADKAAPTSSAKKETPRAIPVRQSPPAEKPVEKPVAEPVPAAVVQPEPEAQPEVQPQPEPEAEPASAAKHAARATARRENGAPVGDKAQA